MLLYKDESNKKNDMVTDDGGVVLSFKFKDLENIDLMDSKIEEKLKDKISQIPELENRDVLVYIGDLKKVPSDTMYLPPEEVLGKKKSSKELV